MNDLYVARDKKLQQTQAVKLKSIVSKKFMFLKEDVRIHRETANNLIDGSKRRLLSVLSDHREFYLAFNHLLPCVRSRLFLNLYISYFDFTREAVGKKCDYTVYIIT